MSRIKYLVSYTGPSYGSLTQDDMDGMASLREAMLSMRARQRGWDDVRGYRLDVVSDVYRLVDEYYTRFPATTQEDVMDVYHAVWDKDSEGYILGDWAYRITVGPRGGIRAEKA